MALRQAILPISRFLKQRIVGDLCNVYTDFTANGVDGTPVSLAAIPFSTSNSYMMINYEPTNMIFYPVNCQHLSVLKVQLQNSNHTIIRYNDQAPNFQFHFVFKLVLR